MRRAENGEFAAKVLGWLGVLCVFGPGWVLSSFVVLPGSALV
jgi:hypothetical protein